MDEWEAGRANNFLGGLVGSKREPDEVAIPAPFATMTAPLRSP
jgi:hypothetical protein